MRQIILDTETTGISVESGHRVIEIGMVEIIDRRLTGNDFQAYLNPQRKIDPATIPIHGLTDEFIADKPLFKDIASEFLSFINGSEVIMHNAPFDSSFINNEFSKTNIDKRLEDICEITDSLTLARKKHPGQRNSLDALCSRYEVNTSSRELHGALTPRSRDKIRRRTLASLEELRAQATYINNCARVRCAKGVIA